MLALIIKQYLNKQQKEPKILKENNNTRNRQKKQENKRK
jgi:hypothetical protein